jgi:two-component system sensor histidine kinase UhpB
MFERDSTSGQTIRETPTAQAESFADQDHGPECAPEPALRRGTRDRVIRRAWLRCAAVLAEVAAAFFLRELAAHHQPDFAPFITFYPAVLLASLLDGAVAGIAVTVMATVAAAIWIFPPLGRLAVADPYDLLAMGIFFAFGVSLSIVVELYHRNRERLSEVLVDEAVSLERKQRESERRVAESVRAERQRLLDVMEALPAMVSLRRPDHRIQFANRSFREKFGDPGGRRCHELRYGRSEPCENCETFLPLETGQPNHREVVFPDSSLIEAYDFPFTDLDGSSLILEMGLDVTDRRRAEIELQRHREHLEELVAERTRQLETVNARLENEIRQLEHAQQKIREGAATLEAALAAMTDSVIITDAAGRFLKVNDAFATFYRLTDQDECPLNLEEFSSALQVSTPSGEPLPLDAFPSRRALRGETASNVELAYLRKDTGESWIGSLSFSPVRAQDGTITGAVITSHDITARKRDEAALRESEKIAMQREQFQALAERLRRAREEERTRVARDLHDQIGQILTAIKLDLTWMNRHLPKPSDELRQRLQGTINLINDGMRSVRKICSGLRPGVLDDLGLAAAIEWQANEFSSRTGMDCVVSVPATERTLEGDQATEFFRIFQECLTNVIRHAEAHSVRVTLNEDQGDLILIVSDDGKGFRESEVAESLGFLGMKERAQMCGGSVEIASSPGCGTTVTLRVPAPSPSLSDTGYAHTHH